MIETVTRDTGAASAGLRQNDIILALDTTEIVNCDGLVKEIQAREAGQAIKIKIDRGGAAQTLETTLPSRADVLRKRHVGMQIPLKMVTRVDDMNVTSLAAAGKTTIVGWFDQDRCSTCASAFSKIQDWTKTKKGAGISVVGVTASNYKSIPETLADLKKAQRNYDVPLLLADNDTFQELSITDIKRIHFMVVDCRGIITYVTPLKPDADDRGAVLDELYSATEQAARRMK